MSSENRVKLVHILEAEGMTMKECASTLGVSLSAVEKWRAPNVRHDIPSHMLELLEFKLNRK